MPKVTNFTFCEQGIIEDNEPKAINLLQVLRASAGSISFSILFSITGFSAHQDHLIIIEFTNPKGEKVIETDPFHLEKEDNQENVDESRLVTGISMGIDFANVLFEGQGLYTLNLLFDGEQIGEFFIPVIVEEGTEE